LITEKKIMNRRRFLGRTVVIAGSLGVFSYTLAEILNINDAINKSGRQRMLSQRLAKAYLQLGQAIDSERSRKILDASLSLFDRQLAELRTFAPTADNKLVLAEMEKTWLAYKQVLMGKTPNQQDARNIMVINEEILAMAQTATVQLEKYSGSSTAQLVNIAGRQRMLSQRMAKFYQALQWGVAPADAEGKLELARKEFIAAMQTLNNAPGNTARIRDELMLAQQQWMFFDGALHQNGDQRNRQQNASNVATTSERILEVMDGVTGLYQQLS
jgi:nitrate/nitrite-specific signal transduction histidine kinase